MGVASGCGCKEVYRFPHIYYVLIPTPRVSVPFCSSIPTFCSFFFYTKKGQQSQVFVVIQPYKD